jgi:hypothetical protein
LFGIIVVPRKTLEEKTGSHTAAIYISVLTPTILYNIVAIATIFVNTIQQDQQTVIPTHIAVMALTQILAMHHVVDNLLRAVLPVGCKTTDALSVCPPDLCCTEISRPWHCPQTL